MSEDDLIRTETYRGSRSTALTWGELKEFFESLCDKDPTAAKLESYPAVIGSTVVSWVGADGNERRCESFADLKEPYEWFLTYCIKFYSSRPEWPHFSFLYWPGTSPPHCVLENVHGDVDAVRRSINLVARLFPDPPGGRLIFMSWGREQSKRVASVLTSVLRERVAPARVFFSEEDISAGENPLEAMLEAGVRRARVLIACITKESLHSDAMRWEIAAAWGSGALVIPLLVDAHPSDLPWPLPDLAQCTRITDRDKLDKAISMIVEAAGRTGCPPLNETEWGELSEIAAVGPD